MISWRLKACLLALALAFSGAAVSCGGDSGSGPGDDTDIDVDPDGELDGDEDTDDVPDVDLEDLLGLGEVCEENPECASNLCIQIGQGIEDGFCTRLCTEDSDCLIPSQDGGEPEQYDCLFLQSQGGDLVQVCVPPNLCIDRDGDGYGSGPGCAGPDCDETNSEIYLGADEVCDGVDNDCDGLVDERPVDVGQTCDTGIPGICADGRTSCEGGVPQCNPILLPGDLPEICDGLDNDCDGEPDNNVPGTGLACVAGGSQCADGLTVCNGENGIVCAGGTGGNVDDSLCDYQDNDCDGSVDEDVSGLNELCTAGEGVCRNFGVTICVANDPDAAPRCSVDPNLANQTAEVCDGLDNDCDGIVDNNLPEVDDTCDGFDDDCDGRIDEDVAGLGEVCNAGNGICQGFGVRVCDPDDADAPPVCNAEPRLSNATDEVCDGIDNDCDGTIDNNLPADDLLCDGLDDDCDGQIDEDVEDIGTVCTAGDGICQGFGTNRCDPNDAEAPVVCNATPRSDNATAEVCNGLDDDCDGVVDNNVPTVDDTCDNFDDDCDGQIDEDVAGLGDVCSAGEGICAAFGTRRCDPNDADAPPVCNAEANSDNATAEVCDGLDNDCDGTVDNNLPSVDNTCDGFDDDCDGLIDEDVAGLGDVCSAGDGVCQAFGVTRCAPGNPSAPPVCSATPNSGNAGPEVCDGLDNDCNGSVDDNLGSTDNTCDGFDDDCDGSIDEDVANLGNPCSAGDGVCTAFGVFRCGAGPSDPVVCSATPASGNAQPEACNYNDDDCDGTVDNGFVDAQGRYTAVTDCGGCGTDCNNLWQPSPAAFNVAPTCGLVGGSASCGYSCINGYVDADGIEENGCELLPDAGAIYVARPQRGGVNNGSCGTYDAPCATIDFGITRALNTSRARVRVADGSYPEGIEMEDGVSVLGGHNSRNWTRNPEINVTVITGAITQDNDVMGVMAVDITQPTELSGLTITPPSASNGGNAIGIYVRNSNSSFEIRDNTVFAGNGGQGTNGADGNSGQNGTNGANGVASVNNRTNCNDAPNPGGSGGARSCGGQNVAGGSGGSGVCPSYSNGDGNQAGSGGDGAGDDGGDGGDGAFTSYGNYGSGVCSIGGELDPNPGSNGARGNDGAAGTGASDADGSTPGDFWRGDAGGNGGSSTNGSGGGAGGAGNSLLASNGRRYIGATGGGAGSGGCGGDEGSGGGAGGGSFGIFIVSSGGLPTIEDNLISRGLGGRGGSGGDGGTGGEGGLGGVGGVATQGNDWSFCLSNGATGGAGGRGGHGGGGGGGAGGVSFDIYVAGATAPAAYASNNDFNLAAGDNTGGQGGNGGGSLGNDGLDGVNGAFGSIRSEP